MKGKVFTFLAGVAMLLVAVGSSYAYPTAPPVDVPEPGTLMLLATTLGGMVSAGLIRRRRK
jgi:hypothetical protein